MIAALLTRHRVLSLRELIAALAREFGWQFTESNFTRRGRRGVSAPPRGAATRAALAISVGVLATASGENIHTSDSAGERQDNRAAYHHLIVAVLPLAAAAD